MTLKRMLFGPDWRSKDAAARLRSVANDHEPELVQQLSLIAREDEDTRVRLAALKRLDDPRRYLEASRDDGDDALRRQALDLALRQLAGERPSTLDIQQRVLLVEEIRQPGELEALARTAREAAVRRAALARVTRSQVLVEAATGDPDAALRLEALARVTEPALLQRIADATRKTDKRVHRSAMDRLNQARLAADDPQTMREHGERICAEAEALMRRPGGDVAAAARRLREQWQALGIAPDHPMQARFRGALEVIDGLLAPKPVMAPVEAEPVPSAEAVEPEEPPEVEAVSEEQPKAEPAAPAPRRKTKPSPPDCSRELESLESLLAEGHVKDARTVESTIMSMRPRGADAARFGELREKLAEMLRWQRWSMRDQRARLCDEAEKLIDSGIHPDALATRIRELRQQWTALETLAGEDAPEGITRRFHALCHRVLKPAKTYFQKREAMRGDHTEAAKELVAEIGQALEGEDLRPLRALRRRATDTLRDAANLKAGERTSLIAAIKQALTDIDARLGAANAEVMKRKKALVAEAEALADIEPGKAVREAKRLQAEWKTAGMGSRRDEEPLWKRFRAACDRVFGELDSQRAEREAQAGAQRAEAEALIARIEALGHAPEDAELREVRGLWRRLDVRESELRRRFDAAEAAIEQRRAEARQAELRARLETLLTEADARHSEVSEAGAGIEAAATMCVRLELLAGMPSPAKDRQRRMDYQVSRLAERMSGGEGHMGLGEEIEDVLHAWRDLPISAESAAPYAARLRKALDELQQRL
jgi:DNA repair protein SbcC/Rad50